MAETTGFVQKLEISKVAYTDATIACTWIGPTPTDAELLVFSITGSEASTGVALKGSVSAHQQSTGYSSTRQQRCDNYADEIRAEFSGWLDTARVNDEYEKDGVKSPYFSFYLKNGYLTLPTVLL